MAKLMKVDDAFYNYVRMIKKNTGRPMTEITKNMINPGRHRRRRRGIGDIELL